MLIILGGVLLISVNHSRGSFVDQLIILGGVLLVSVNHFRGSFVGIS